MKIVLAGAGGMLGTALAAAMPTLIPGCEIATLGRDILTPRDPKRVLDAVIGATPSVVLNAAAHTDVEGSESDPDAAYAANAEIPRLLAAACRTLGIPMIHVSSTGCYGAWKDTPYTDYDETHPTTVHHRSKIAGEIAVREAAIDHLIVRTGWLFGGDALQPKNFVFKRMLESSKTDLIRSDPTQTGNPTSVDELAVAILVAFRSGLRGTCNIVSGGSATRLDYVREIVRLSGLPCRVEASEGAFARRAKVSHNEAADMMRHRLAGLAIMAPWQEQLARYVETLRASPAWSARTATGD